MERIPKVDEKWIRKADPNTWAVVQKVIKDCVVSEEHHIDTGFVTYIIIQIPDFVCWYEPEEMENF